MTELVFRDDAYARSCAARVVAADARGIRLDRTVFYPTGGGQPGDTGVLRLASGATIAIADTVKGEGADEVIHVPAPGAALPEPGAEVTAEIDWERRHRLMRMHTCLHLLCAVVPGAVTGGQVSDGRGRLDFDVPGREPRSRGDRRAPQCADRGRPRRNAALDRRRRARRPPRTGAHDVGQAADRRRPGPPDRDCRSRGRDRSAALRRHAHPQHRRDRPG